MRSVVLAAVALTACAQMPKQDGDATPSPTPAHACDASPVQDLIERPAAVVSDDAKSRSGAKTVRSYANGSAVTMDFRPDRLNIETDASGAIVKLSCG